VISLNYLIEIFPWVLNTFSLTTAYCLSNGKITVGRYIGAIAAIGWSTYGFLIEEYSFLFANIIFLYIYSSAIIKFNSKRDEYKETFEEQKEIIEKLHKELNERIKKEDKILNLKKEKIRKIANIAKENLKNIESLEDYWDF
jgi:hypothetical protein